MRQVQAEPLLLQEADEAVQVAQRRTTTAYILAIATTVGVWVWRYALLHHVNLTAIEWAFGFFGAGRIIAYFMCRLEPRWAWTAIGTGFLLLIFSTFIALLP